MAEKSYRGGCHRGAVAFDVKADLNKTITCNCSICSKRGFIWTFAPAAAFTLTKGESATTRYSFHKHAIEHRFCATCGVEAFATGVGPDGRRHQRALPR